jgi:MATE family multidrug resistance protein
LSAIIQLTVMLPALGRSPSVEIQRRPSQKLMAKLVGVGSPIGFQMLFEVGVFAFAGVAAGTFNEVSVAAHQIAITWSSVTFCFSVGVGSAAAVRVGYSVGEGDRLSARRSGFAALTLSVLAMTGSAILFIALPEVFARAMSDVEGVVALASQLFWVAAVFQVFDGIQAVGAGALRGAGDTSVPFWANAIGHYAVGLPIALFLGMKLQFGVVGLWWGLCAGLISVALLLALRFHRLTSHEIRAL